jgi:hypothetical protein
MTAMLSALGIVAGLLVACAAIKALFDHMEGWPKPQPRPRGRG